MRESPLAPRECPRCKSSNPATNMFCFRCGMALTLEAAMKVEEARAKADEAKR